MAKRKRGSDDKMVKGVWRVTCHGKAGVGYSVKKMGALLNIQLDSYID